MKFSVSDHCVSNRIVTLESNYCAVLEQQIKGQNASKGLDGGQFGPSGLKMASHGIPGKTQRIENFTIFEKIR